MLKLVQHDRLNDVLLFLFLLLIPTQLGRHFWPEWSQVLGIRIDYLSPTLYLVDVVWILLLIFNLQFKINKRFFNFKFINVLILLLIGLNILVAENRWEAVYWWLRVGQWVWTVGYISENKEKVWWMLKTIIPIWLIVEGGLAVAQMAKGGSLQGLFYWLGERRFSFSSLGVARLAVAGKSMIRAYGTFSHPNSLAGFLLVALVLMRQVKIRKLWFWVASWFGVVGIILAGSRTIWVLGLVLLIFDFKRALGKITIAVGFFLIVLGMVSVNYRTGDFLGGWDDESFQKRWSLNARAVEMIKDNPLLGVGLGNFMVELPEYQRGNGFFWMQPVHNIFLLVLSEIGVVGGLIFNLKFIQQSWISQGSKILKQFRILKFNNLGKLALLIIVVTGMVDHYWVTLPQNRWLVAVVVGLL